METTNEEEKKLSTFQKLVLIILGSLFLTVISHFIFNIIDEANDKKYTLKIFYSEKDCNYRLPVPYILLYDSVSKTYVIQSIGHRTPQYLTLDRNNEPYSTYEEVRPPVRFTDSCIAKNFAKEYINKRDYIINNYKPVQ